MSTIKEVKQAVIGALNAPNVFMRCNNTKNRELYVVLVNGKRIITNSGKSVWPGKGPAKSALRNHMAGLLYRRLNGHKVTDGDKIDYVTTRNTIKEAEDEWIEKHVVFVPFIKWFATQKKISK